MKRKIILFAGALALVFAAGTAQAHGSLFGIFFKHHKHNACGYHNNDHRPCHVYKHKKVKKHYGHHYKRHSHSYHGHGYHGNSGKQLIW